MQADVAAAFLDFATTVDLYRAMLRNEAPRPSASRSMGGRRRPVWALDALRAYVARRHQLTHDAAGQEVERIEGLI
jgi:hypothetical protein